jgi:hypothetical protein
MPRGKGYGPQGDGLTPRVRTTRSTTSPAMPKRPRPTKTAPPIKARAPRPTKPTTQRRKGY